MFPHLNNFKPQTSLFLSNFSNNGSYTCWYASYYVLASMSIERFSRSNTIRFVIHIEKYTYVCRCVLAIRIKKCGSWSRFNESGAESAYDFRTICGHTLSGAQEVTKSTPLQMQNERHNCRSTQQKNSFLFKVAESIYLTPVRLPRWKLQRLTRKRTKRWQQSQRGCVRISHTSLVCSHR